MNRGSIDSRAGLHIGVVRFNEAPIHESGKYLAHGTVTSFVAELQ